MKIVITFLVLLGLSCLLTGMGIPIMFGIIILFIAVILITYEIASERLINKAINRDDIERRY